MPAIIDTPEHIDLEEIATHDLTIEEQPLERKARPGFWHTLAHRITTSLTPVHRERYAPLCHVSRPFEAPMDRFIREHPFISVYALAPL